MIAAYRTGPWANVSIVSVGCDMLESLGLMGCDLRVNQVTPAGGGSFPSPR